MRFRFRGTRGSLPAPGPDTVRYGGNTTCIEVRSDAGELIILDAGTGIRELGIELMAARPVKCHIFISHTHWDHIHGLPFFLPLFTPGNAVTLYGPPDPLAMTGIEAVLSKQMEYPHFPVRVAELRADIAYRTLADRQAVDLGFATVSTLLMNHPAMDFGCKVRCDGKTLFFTGDHEPYYNIYAPGDADFEEYGRIVDERNKALTDFLRGVDILVADAQYAEEEYRTRRGWGHSTFERTLSLAREAGIARVYLTHHETTRTDDEMDVILARLRREWEGCGFDFDMAREGDDLVA
ncbi:MAG: MBL fold metallo-hydrolase [Pseudodesulfovibrio sp.]|uniref:Beta-lactamase domain protein n=1 Tax=Pseudodesulfovibrio aespoeensis (strain ATCC 700646 / DSM 10631 / Aspo-2) TaxID=643562 RepID=E6VU18_PSEA9|nr:MULTISPECIES: MBL fold metallo-hydrolase [Pseudodesulfovibrio]MBU4191739.1 MBL fold metallo-hydrolase [Pseudomonadota bacterium]ADU62211.1 beta-lactamase domain protein [Pseudodesulfovibrio aespoeensis Aspo-2]MBU4243191.1 MBL fold metallo-hydrolase [Pseudomonadota bacterium]MBU4377559.1 MBL fold metallo-hydrolase [Pseudomonadota bacterium]MBU4476100.1 MBL fold metallo-hydrolase [Pseudomonadota bacterium]